MTSRGSVAWPDLEKAAREVQTHAHAPYSGYRVGAALITESGRVFAGCNVENASYGLSICAERAAIVQMVAAGERAPLAIVVVTPGKTPGTPCGMCRQTLAEFAEDLPVRLLSSDDPALSREVTLGQLLPDAFRPEVLGAAPR